ncbi:hypothetical protein JOC86_001481 [Bacillus pakistanensis]|uniref:Uncharacterized protein n=1 Tax=Rossellomorea pakistanensis TaxID=992288 RepID=A0ABS2NB07_9BACI|nr:hypothetical protein [Bacillus pakistanensis]MBM7584944.1 hypothetical protein [Bacillus pakistanensis]
MNKQRYLLCLLLAGVMLYYAVPRINLYGDGLSGIFTISWLGLCLLVIAGNLSAMLFTVNKKKNEQKQVAKSKPVRRQSMRSFG